MSQPVEQSGCHFGIAAEHRRPFGEAKVGVDQNRGAGIKLADQMEQQLTATLGEGQIPQFVQHDEIDAGELVG